MRALPLVALLASVDLGLVFVTQTWVIMSVGFGLQTDAYFAAQVVPVCIFGVLQLALSRAMVAAFATRGSAGFPAGCLLISLVAVMLAIMCALAVTAPWWFEVLFPQIADVQHALAMQVVWAQGVSVAVLLLHVALTALNHVRGRFVTAELISVVSTCMSLLFVLMTVERLGVLSAAYGGMLKSMVAALLSFMTLAPLIRSGPVPWAELWAVIRPVASGSALTKFSPAIDRTMAAAGSAGALSMLTFAQAIYGAATGLAERVLVAPRMPDIRRGVSLHLLMPMIQSLGLSGILLAGGISALVYLSADVGFLADRFGSDELRMLSSYLAALFGFVVGGLAGQWCAAALSVLGRADLVARVAVYGFIASIPLKLFAFGISGVPGLALAVSGYYLVNASVLAMLVGRVQRRHGPDEPAK